MEIISLFYQDTRTASRNMKTNSRLELDENDGFEASKEALTRTAIQFIGWLQMSHIGYFFSLKVCVCGCLIISRTKLTHVQILPCELSPWRSLYSDRAVLIQALEMLT